MKYQITSIIVFFSFANVSCQNEKPVFGEKDVALKLVEKVCNELSAQDSNVEEYLLTAKNLIQNDEIFNREYRTEIQSNETSSRIEEKFDSYFKFLLRRDCKEYRDEYDELDKNYADKPILREAYLNNRNLLFGLFDNEESSKLIQYFEMDNEEELKDHLEQIKVGFDEAKDRAFIHTTKLNREEIVFYNNLSDYISGNEKLRIVFVFDDAGEKIRKYAFNYGEVEIIKELK